MEPTLLTSVAISVGFLVSMGIVLSALLVVAERKILNYGPATIDINEGEKLLEIKGGSSLLSSLSQHSVFIPSACGGRGSCAYCKVAVLDGGGPVGPVEAPYLSAEELAKGIRLSCQVKIRNNLKIKIPRELFSVRRYRAKLEHKKRLTHDIMELRFELLDPGVIDFVAGQYMQLESAPYKGCDSVIRAYSISSVPSDKSHVELIVRLVPKGICTTWVFEVLKEGQEVNISGPYGDFRLAPTEAPIIFIAGGSGMAPIWSMLRYMKETGITRQATYFFGARTQADLFFLEEMAQLQSQMPTYTFVPALSNEPEDSDWKGERGLITDVVARHFPDTSKHEAYLCGAPGMIDASIKVLTNGGMPATNVFYDKFS